MVELTTPIDSYHTHKAHANNIHAYPLYYRSIYSFTLASAAHENAPESGCQCTGHGNQGVGLTTHSGVYIMPTHTLWRQLNKEGHGCCPMQWVGWVNYTSHCLMYFLSLNHFFRRFIEVVICQRGCRFTAGRYRHCSQRFAGYVIGTREQFDVRKILAEIFHWYAHGLLTKTEIVDWYAHGMIIKEKQLTGRPMVWSPNRDIWLVGTKVLWLKRDIWLVYNWFDEQREIFGQRQTVIYSKMTLVNQVHHPQPIMCFFQWTIKPSVPKSRISVCVFQLIIEPWVGRCHI